MDRTRWGLVATLLLGAILISGCGWKYIGTEEYERLLTYEGMTQKQGKELSALLAENAALEAEREAVRDKLAEMERARGDDQQLVSQYKEGIDELRAKMEELTTERDRLAGALGDEE